MAMNEAGSGQYGQAPPIPPSSGGPSADAMRRVQGPAIALIITAVLGIFLHALRVFAHMIGLGFAGLAGQGREEWAFLQMLAGTLGIIIAILGSLVGIVIIVGAVK